MAKRTKPRKTPKPQPARPRATTVERAEQALEQASDKPPPRTDDPARDKATIEDGVIKPLKHAD
ncbi:MAG TPA: hypothetical protein VM261_36645 [Kofleriaceae bacterium]|nr:hypothetical protein [Kofleriaceae bacterium]